MFTIAAFTALPDLVDRHGEKLIAAFTALMVAFFLSFVAILAQATSATQAAAASAQTCSGADLVAQYKANEPEKFATLEAQAAKITNGDAVFWKIEKDGLQTSYLLGTMHMADTRIAKLESARLEAFRASETIIIENIEALDPAQASAALLEHKDKTLYTDGTTLADRLDADSLERLKAATEERGMPFAMVQIMQPWLVATSVALPACELAAKRSGAPVLDGLVANKAKEAGKTLIGLETIGEQFSAMSNLPESFHLKALTETLKLGSDVTEDVMETMKQLYLSGRIDMITPLTKLVSPQTGSSEEFKDFEQSLIVKRNGVMIERSLPYLEKGAAFVAVGALHLPGESGLVNGFREAGYTVSAVR